MDHALLEDWAEGSVIVIPHAWRGDGLWIEIQSEVQEQIGTTLRAMYAELLQQPLPRGLERLVQQIELGSETLPYEC